MVGIVALGAYVPRNRLQRQAIVASVAWFNAGLKGLAAGERAMAGWDEDAVTMALEAARDCLADVDRARVGRLVLASTTLPFADRQNAGIVKEALNLTDEVGSQDVTGSQRAGTSALLNALMVARSEPGEVLCVAAEHRRSKPASEAELVNGHAAAAFLVGTEGVLAEFLGGHSVTTDFVDHFRATGEDYDYAWEARWVRDEGYGKIAPAAVKTALAKLGLTGGDIDRFVMPAPMRGVNNQVAAACGVRAEAVQDALADRLGDAGCAQPLVLLANALASAKPGEKILLVGFGQGCDVLVFQATDAIEAPSHRLGVQGWLARRRAEDNYIKHLFFGGALQLDGGMRAEMDDKTALTTLYRNRKTVLGLVGGRCTETGTVQFPKSEISVSQNHRASHTQEDYPLADRVARITTYTADSLAYTPDPPGYYGMVEFEGGGRLTTEFADIDPDAVEVGQAMRMMFRIKSIDEMRGFKRYFWKAVPDYRAAALGS
jgi:3-hydroxy-3-methylglutaryl CoA synthase